MGVLGYIAKRKAGRRGNPPVVSLSANTTTAAPGFRPHRMSLGGRRLSGKAYDFVEAYKSTAFSCIGRRAQGIASIERIPQRRLDPVTTQALPYDHWLPRVLRRPTALPHITPNMIWKWIEIWHCGVGESYLITPVGKDPMTGFEVPIGLYPVPASSMIPQLGPDGFIESYLFHSVSGAVYQYPAYQVCYFMNAAPASDPLTMYTRGKGLVEAAISDILADEAIKDHIRTSLSNLIPPYFIKGDPTETQKESLIQDLQDWKDGGSTTPMGFMDPKWDIVSVDQLPLAKEAQLMSLPYRQSICEALDVPIGFFDTKQLNGKATVETLLYMFRVFTLEARMQEILETLNQHFQQFEARIELGFTATDRRDSDAERLEDAFLLANTLATPNMLAKRRGLPAVPKEQGGDTYFAPSTLVPAQSLINGPTEPAGGANV